MILLGDVTWVGKRRRGFDEDSEYLSSLSKSKRFLRSFCGTCFLNRGSRRYRGRRIAPFSLSVFQRFSVFYHSTSPSLPWGPSKLPSVSLGKASCRFRR